MRVITIARTNKFSPCVCSAAYALMTYRRQQILPGHGSTDRVSSRLLAAWFFGADRMPAARNLPLSLSSNPLAPSHTYHLIDWLHPRRDETSRTLVRTRRHVRILSPGPANKRLILRPRSRSSGPPFWENLHSQTTLLFQTDGLLAARSRSCPRTWPSSCLLLPSLRLHICAGDWSHRCKLKGGAFLINKTLAVLGERVGLAVWWNCMCMLPLAHTR